MPRISTWLFFIACLLAGLAWWLDQSPSTKPPTPPPAAEAPTAPPEPTPPSGAGKTPTTKSSTDTTPPLLRSEETSLLELNIEARQSNYYQAPPSSLVSFACYQTKSYPYANQLPADAKLLGHFQTDTEGRAQLRLPLPTNPKGSGFARNILLLVPQSPGWQSWPVSISISPYSQLPLSKKIIFAPGTVVSVRLIGANAENFSQHFRQYQLDLYQLTPDPKRLSQHYFPKPLPSTRSPLCAIPIDKKGRYRIFARCPDGVGLLDSISIDPQTPPAELTIVVEEFGIIEGQIQMPFGPPDFSWSVFAIATNLATTDKPDWNLLLQSPLSFPASWSKCSPDANGHFRLNGLAPGRYRLAYGSDYLNQDYGGWLQLDPIPTGSHPVDIPWPGILLQPHFVDSTTGHPIEPTSKLQFSLEKQATSPEAHAWKLQLQDTPNHGQGYFLFPGHRYHLLAWSPEYSAFETVLQDPMPSGVWNLPIELHPAIPGTLLWTGPEEQIHYSVLSVETRQLLYSTPEVSWTGSQFKMECQLPPGEYILRAAGRTNTDMHGGVGRFRSPYGVEEQRVQIAANQTTTIAMHPPLAAWLEIELQAEGQPNPSLQHAPPSFVPNNQDFFTLDVQHPYFFLRPTPDGQGIALIFQHWGGGSAVYSSAQLQPGKTAKALQSLPPGDYVLEVRVPGFPYQEVPLQLKAQQWTHTTIQLQAN